MATLAHRSPDAPFRGVAHPVGAMKERCRVALETSAAFCISASQFVCVRAEHIAAVAPAKVARHIRFSPFGARHDGQASEGLANKINGGWHFLCATCLG